MKKAPESRTLPTRQDIKNRFSTVSTKTLSFVDRRPLTSFFAILALIMVLILVGNFLNKPKPETKETVKTVKTVSRFRIGSAPKITVSAQTKKSGVIEIVALTGGVVDKINVQEGSVVKKGDQLVGMSSNYAGANTFSLQRQIAATQYQGAASTYDKQKETIEQQKELVEKTEDNSEELRKITDKSLGETRTLISQNEDVLKLLDEQIATFNQLYPNPTAAEKAEFLLPLKAQQVQFTASVNQAKQALKANEYSSDDDNPPADIASLTKEIAKKQFDVQLKQLKISLEVSRLQANLAQINESMMYPTSPFAGTIQRVLVKEKQQVNAGTTLMIISQVAQEDPITAVAFVSADVARRVSRIEPSTLHIGDKASYTSIPSFVSTDAVQGTLYAVYYPIPETYSNLVISEGYISVDMPIGNADTSMIATYIPLDSVYQTRERAYVFTAENGVAQSREVQLGSVYGGYVEVLSGLKNGDDLILNRNIIKGDFVKFQ